MKMVMVRFLLLFGTAFFIVLGGVVSLISSSDKIFMPLKKNKPGQACLIVAGVLFVLALIL